MVTMTPDRLRQLRRVGDVRGFRADCLRRRALYASFPYDRAKEAATRMSSKTFDVDVEIGSAGPAFGLAVMFRDIRVRTRPTTGKADPLHDRLGEVLAVAVRAVLVVVSLQPDGGRAGRHDRARSVGRTRQEGRLPDRARRARHRRVRDPRRLKETINMPAHRQGDAGGEARLRDRPLRGRQRSADAQLRRGSRPATARRR